MVRIFSCLVQVVSILCIIACGGGSSNSNSSGGNPQPNVQHYYYNVDGVSDFYFSEPYITNHIFAGEGNLFERFDLATDVTYTNSNDPRVQYYFLDFYIVPSDAISESDFDQDHYAGAGDEIALLAFNPTDYHISLNASYDYPENKLYATVSYLGIDYKINFIVNESYDSDIYLLTVSKTQIVEFDGSFSNYISWKVMKLPFELF